jgi:CRP-like cAMP-binding protein
MRKNSAEGAVQALERGQQGTPAMNWRATELAPPRTYRNRLLDAFPPDDLRRWEGFLELVRLNSGQVLCGPGIANAHVFFPVDAIVSLVCLTQDGGCTEIASVGNDGVVGVNLFVGGSAATSQAVTQCAGLAYRMKASLLREEFNRSLAVRQIMLRYMQALLTQSAQMAVCNRHHTVEQQLCRWLLLALDRSPTNQLSLTQEMIANALGVRRAGVTESASKLRKAGMLRCQRGKILVLDRVRLEHHACECYATIRDELAQVVPASAGSAERLHADFDLHARVHTTELDHGHPTATIPPPATGVDLAVKRLVGQQARSAVNGSHYYNGQTR